MDEKKDLISGLEKVVLPLLLLVTLLCFAPAGRYDFLSYDDQGYVAANPQVRAGLTRNGLSWAFQDASLGHWHPLTWLSHMADVELYGLNPGGHHLTNIVFHLLNTGLLFFLFRGWTGRFWPSAFVAALFALHPLNVESVAWISERKNVLSTFFWLATMAAYGEYAKKGGGLRYGAVMALFTLGLMAKPMLVTLPFILLLLDYWPLKRLGGPSDHSAIKNLLKEKLPLFILSGLSIALTLWAAKAGGAMEGSEALAVTTRLANALVSYGAYLAMMIRPTGLSVFYPYPDVIASWKVYASAFFLTAVTAFSFYQARRFPYLIVGWLWYLGALVPVVGLVQVGAQSMADRYGYQPLVGVFIMMAWGIADLAGERPKRRAILIVSALAVLAALGIGTGQQVRYWQSSETLFRHSVAVTSGNFLAHYHLGKALQEKGDREGALHHFLEAARVKPNYEPAYLSMGAVRQHEGRFTEALMHYRQALAVKPDYADAYYALGTLFFETGRLDDALASYHRAIGLKPKSAPMYNNLGVCLVKKGNLKDAADAFRQALLLNPEYAGAHHNLALVLENQGQPREAADHRRQAQQIKSRERGP